MKILVSCLEPSANLHFGEVLKHLNGVEICGIFDKKFAEFGAPLYESSEFSAMGFVEILPLILKAKRALKEMVNLAKSCDAVLLVDSPAFNLPLAKALKKAHIKAKITYYILPQVWAWKRKRVKKVEAFCDNLASILPFDAQFYTRATYVGHPLLDEICVKKTSANLNLAKNETVAFLPGSRKSEISRLMPVYREVRAKLPEKTNALLVVPPHLKGSEIYGDVAGFTLVYETHEALLKSDFAFVCSGTATLEAALIGTPFLLCYKANKLDIFLARLLVKLKHVGLANIIFDFTGGEELHREFIGDEVSAANLLGEFERCDRGKFAAGCEALRKYLAHGSSESVAQMLKEL